MPLSPPLEFGVTMGWAADAAVIEVGFGSEASASFVGGAVIECGSEVRAAAETALESVVPTGVPVSADASFTGSTRGVVPESDSVLEEPAEEPLEERSGAGAVEVAPKEAAGSIGPLPTSALATDTGSDEPAFEAEVFEDEGVGDEFPFAPAAEVTSTA